MQKELSASTVSPHVRKNNRDLMALGRLFFYCEHENDHKDQDNDDRGNVHDVFTPPVSRIGTGRIGTSRFPETKVAEEKERTNRLSRWGRDNSLRSAVFTANNSSISYYY